jgi:2-C-methyl-D-erythritol 4-phosphate cytidylyltransferase
MVMHTLAAMLAVQRMHRVLLVVSASDGFWQGRATDARLGIAACGGATRAETVSNGLQELLRMGASGEDWVLVHDAARCLVASAQVNALIDACLPDAVGAAGAEAARHAQAAGRRRGPGACGADGGAQRQMAGSDAADVPYRSLAGCAAGGGRCRDRRSQRHGAGRSLTQLVPGGAQNFKVTYPDDFALAEAVLLQRKARG